MTIEKSIGGYFGLEMSLREEYYSDMIRLNSGRNAFEYILRAKKYKKIFLPYFTCVVMLEPIEKLDLEVEFYSIDANFKPIFDFSKVGSSEVFLYTNYFGICDKQAHEINQKCKNLIIDNAQGFYSKPMEGVDTFYSPRKFFGVSDGAYLHTNTKIDEVLERDNSYARFSHHLKRIDCSAEEGYDDFVKNDNSLKNNPIKEMSALTTKLLASIDYNCIAFKRRENFMILHSALANKNKLKFDFNSSCVPLVYPFWGDKKMRKILVNNRVYTATYWPNIKEWCDEDTLEYKMMNNLIHLPIDQRYGQKEMDFILKLLK